MVVMRQSVPFLLGGASGSRVVVVVCRLSGEGEEHLVEVGLAHRDVVELDSRLRGATAVRVISRSRVESTRTLTRRVASSICATPSPSRPSSSAIVATSRLSRTCTSMTLPPIRCLSCGRGAGRDSPTVVDDHDLAGEMVGLIEVLRGQQNVGPLLDEGADRVPQLDPATRVQACRGLIEQQQPRSADQARTEVQPPAHPA